MPQVIKPRHPLNLRLLDRNIGGQRPALGFAALAAVANLNSTQFAMNHKPYLATKAGACGVGDRAIRHLLNMHGAKCMVVGCHMKKGRPETDRP